MASTKLTQTKISDTYGGVLHSNGEALPVSTLVDIYDGIGNKSSLKLGRACNGAAVCGTLTCDLLATSSLSCTTLNITNPLALINIIYPVGSVYFSVNNTNPSSFFTGTSWMQISQGRYIAGVGTTVGEASNGTTTISVSGNTGSLVQSISTAKHDHGVGKFTDNTGDNAWFNYSNWSTLDGSIYTMRRVVGADDDDIYVTGQTGSPYGISTSTPTSNTSYNINTQPPSFGLYVWQRLS